MSREDARRRVARARLPAAVEWRTGAVVPLITGAGGGSFAAKEVHPAAEPVIAPVLAVILPPLGLRLNDQQPRIQERAQSGERESNLHLRLGEPPP